MERKVSRHMAQSLSHAGEIIVNMEMQKRQLITALEADRGEMPARPSGEVGGAPAEMDGGDLDDLQRRLRGAEATCKMFEETLQSFEGKLLDAIADNGLLHQEIDKLMVARLEDKSAQAAVSRQRDQLRARVEELLGQGEVHLKALAAAEREILYLTSKLQDKQTKTEA